ncbi:MAG TPA: hypothetical protein VKS79_01310 [Gemmataceae bacterium]|nr:hypothetical protein [Gemmataceae bacterium]
MAYMSLLGLVVLFLLLAGGAALVVLVVVTATRGAGETQRNLDRSIKSLAGDFPDEVRARGGEDSLRDSEFVSLWIKQLETPNGAASSTTMQVAAPPPKLQIVLSAMLQRLLADHLAVAKRFLPPGWRIVFVSLVLGYLFGHFCGEVVFSINHPRDNKFPHFYDFPGFDTGAYAAGFGFGITMFWVLTALQAFLWYHRLEHLRRTAAERAKEIENDFSEVVRATGGAAGLRYTGPVRSLQQALKVSPQALADAELQPQTREQLRQAVRSGWLRQIHDGLQEAESWQHAHWSIVPISLFLGFVFGELFGEWIFALDHSPLYGRFPFIFFDDRFDLWALLAGVGMGILVGLVIFSGQLLLWRWLRNRVQKSVQTCIHDFQTDFADDIRTWGGPSVLRTSEAVQELLRERV